MPVLGSPVVGPQGGDAVVELWHGDLSDGDAGGPVPDADVHAAAEAEVRLPGPGDVEGLRMCWGHLFGFDSDD